MRDIKFRAWDKQLKRMYYDGSSDISNCLTYAIDGGMLTYDSKSSFTLMQYTGLKDKNGKEIYEGDIMSSCLKHNVIEGIVFYQAPSFVMKKTKRARTWTTFNLAETENQFQEVIGNIYENPALLKEE